MTTTDCEAFRQQADRAFAGELGEQDHVTLLQHTETCEECRGYYDVIEELSASSLDMPAEDEFLAMRRDVIRTIRRDGEQVAPLSWLSWSLLARGFAVAAGIVAIFGFGLLVGSTRDVRRGQAPLASSGDTDVVLARHIGTEARNNRALADIENSPFRYTNVKILEAADGRLDLAFDVSRHMQMTLRRDDPLVTEVLVQSLLDPTSVGTQLKAISEAENVVDPKIRAALIKAMREDPNLGVRLEAQARLAASKSDPSAADAMLGVLAREPSVQMRLVAIDYLTRSRVDPDRLRKAVDAGDPEGRAAVYVRARNYIQSF